MSKFLLEKVTPLVPQILRHAQVFIYVNLYILICAYVGKQVG